MTDWSSDWEVDDCGPVLLKCNWTKTNVTRRRRRRRRRNQDWPSGSPVHAGIEAMRSCRMTSRLVSPLTDAMFVLNWSKVRNCENTQTSSDVLDTSRVLLLHHHHRRPRFLSLNRFSSVPSRISFCLEVGGNRWCTNQSSESVFVKVWAKSQWLSQNVCLLHDYFTQQQNITADPCRPFVSTSWSWMKNMSRK